VQHVVHRRQRVAQLVGEGGDEFVLGAVGVGKLVVQGAQLRPRGEQFFFVFVAVGDDHHGDVLPDFFANLAAHDVEQHRYDPAVAMHHVESHFCDRFLHLQQRQQVGLVENAAAHAQQVLQALFGQRGRGIAEPALKGQICAKDVAVGVRHQQPAGGVLEQV
jgi:hypothetical protein